LLIYRICRAGFAALDGEGARLYGGRWNRPGRPVVYTSSSLALAALEYLVHVDPPEVPPDLTALAIEVPDDIPSWTVDATDLPPGWSERVRCDACEALGDGWLDAGATALLRVPSAPVPEEANVLIDPRHRDARRVRVVKTRPFAFDPRLLT